MIVDSENTNLSKKVKSQLNLLYSKLDKTKAKKISIEEYRNKLVMASDIFQIHKIVYCIRIILSDADDPKIEELVQSGLVPYFIHLAREQISPQLTTEITWILTNVASGNQAQTQEIVNNGGIQLFVNLLESKEKQIQDNAIWGLGNIAGDCIIYRDLILSTGAIESMIKAYKQISRTIDLKNMVWSLSNLCRGNPVPKYEKVRICIEVFCYAILDESNDVVLADALWALSYLNARPGGDEEASTLILKSNILNRLIDLLDHTVPSIQLPALRIVGNIVTGDEQSTDQVLQAGFLKKIPQLLKNPKKILKKETCWTLSNITAGTVSQNIQIIHNEQIINQIFNLIETEQIEVVREVAYIFSNSVCNISLQDIQFLMEKGLFRSYKKILSGFVDQKIFTTVTEGLIQILKKGNDLLENYYLIELKQLELDQVICNISQQFQDVDIKVLYQKFAQLL